MVVQGVHVTTYDLLPRPIHSFGLAICVGMVARRNIKLGANNLLWGLPKVAHEPGISIRYINFRGSPKMPKYNAVHNLRQLLRCNCFGNRLDNRPFRKHSCEYHHNIVPIALW
jgi:hypothetical protein